MRDIKKIETEPCLVVLRNIYPDQFVMSLKKILIESRR